MARTSRTHTVAWVHQCPGCNDDVVVTRPRAGEVEGDRMCTGCQTIARRAARPFHKQPDLTEQT